MPLWSGRHRHFYDPEHEAHKAMNSLMQGGGADVVERQMTRLWDHVANDECRMLLQVHDSVVFEVKIGTEEKYLNRISEIMSDVDALVPGDSFGVAFAVEIHQWGKNTIWNGSEWMSK